MSERKVLQVGCLFPQVFGRTNACADPFPQKYFPPDWDPREISRRKGPKQSGPKIQTVRIMAPFSMKCMSCGEFIYKGRKFNSRKETPLDSKYLGIQIFNFHIKCTRCSAEITFRTDPKNADYAMVSGAVRNMEPWRNRQAEEETVEERLDRLEREEAEAAGEEEKDAMADLEAKNVDARREMAAADALDEIRQRNARIHRSEKEGMDYADAILRPEDEEHRRQDNEDKEAARQAFAAARSRVEQASAVVDGDDAERHTASGQLQYLPAETGAVNGSSGSEEVMGAAPETRSFKRVVKKKKDHSALLGIKKKPSLV